MADRGKGYITRSKTSVMSINQEREGMQEQFAGSSNIGSGAPQKSVLSVHSSLRSASGSYSRHTEEEQVECNFAEELAKLQDDEEELTSKMELIDMDLGTTQSLIDELLAEGDDENEESQQIRQAQLREYRKQVQLKTKEKNIQQVEDKRLRKSISRRREILNKQKKVTMKKIAETHDQLIDSDEEKTDDKSVHSIHFEDHLKEGESDLEIPKVVDQANEAAKTARIETLLKQKENIKAAAAAKVVQQQELKKLQIETDQAVAIAEKERIDLDEELKQLMKVEEHSPTGIINTPGNEIAGDERLINMFAQAISRSNGRPQERSADRHDKFLARQVHGRELPIFNGKPEEWMPFIATYNETTVICEFTPQENLVRLRKCLKGKAWDTVQSLLISHENVPRIIEVLTTYFGQPEFIVESMIVKAKALVPVKDDKPHTFIEFGTSVRNLVETVRSLGCIDYLSNPQLLRDLESKLPSSTCVQWLEYVASDDSKKRNLILFSEWLERRTAIMCRMTFPRISSEDGNRMQNGRDAFQRNKANNFHVKQHQKVFATEEVPTNKFERNCQCCGSEDHPIWKCSDFRSKTVETRDKLVKEKRLCISCLGTGHMMRDCKFIERKCGDGGCSKSHHRLLHRKDRPPFKKEFKGQDGPAPPELEKDETVRMLAVVKPEVILVNENGSNTLMGIIEVLISGSDGKQLREYAYVDPGSSIDIIEEDVRKELGIEGCHSPLSTKGINQTKVHEESRILNCEISGTFRNAKKFLMRNVRTVNQLGLSRATQNLEALSKRWPHLQGLPIKSFNEVKPRILIGSGSIYLTASMKCVGGPVGPLAMKSRLGWYLGGLQHKVRPEKSSQVFTIADREDSDEYLHQLVKKSFALDDIGVKLFPAKNPQSKEDVRALKVMESTTKRIGDGSRFETGLLWKSPEISLPESKSTAMHRLTCQERKMDKCAEFANAYYGKIEEYLEKGFIKKLNEKKHCVKSGRDWYLPHFGVLNPNKPGKLRLVFDAAAMSHGVSLNSTLMQGPDLNNSLIGVLMKFRQYQVAFAGDIRDMFHRVLVRDEDLSSQRFLWRGCDRSKPPDIYQMNVMIFGATCSPSSAQHVKNLNAEEHSVKFPSAAKAIQNKFYVDDYLDSTPTVDEAIKLINEVCIVNSNASFEVCNWTSSSIEVMESIPEDKRAKEWKNMNITEEGIEAGRILGLWWDPGHDKFTFKMNFHKVPQEIVQGLRRPTKREVLKLVMSIYDPLGFVAHLVVKAKIILQDIWRSGLGWDDQITDVIDGRWKMWLAELSKLPEIRIPRCYSSHIPESSEVQLHILCDASEKAYCAIGFLRVRVKPTVYEVNIVCSKTRVSPLKPISIPRLELQAAVMGARLANTIKTELEVKIDRTVYWTDSITVLRWLRNDARRFKQYVSHRVGEIMELCDIAEWRWVPSALNVADDGTRDTAESDLSETSRWFRGADFLYEDEKCWPKEEDAIQTEEISPAILEEKVEVYAIQEAIYVPDIDRFSRYWKLIRVTAWVKRYVSNLRISKENRKLARKLSDNQNLTKELSVIELYGAEKYWWKAVQHQCFNEELKLLHGGKPIPKGSKLFKLSPFIDKYGILRMSGRMREDSDIPVSMQSPIILHSGHRFVKLLVEYLHVKKGHQGQNTVANELRQSFWIIGLMKIVKTVARKCIFCQKQNAKPIVTEMGNIPAVRLKSHLRPFTNTGMDYFGPMVTKEGRRNVKCWGVLFTCMSTRAVHLELAGSLTTDSAIMAIQRMSNRRGTPHHIYSDNGTNFHGADNELKKALGELNLERMESKLTKSGIQWHFNPPAAPHMGGVWERMVGSVKRTLRGMMTSREVVREVLETFLTEVEFIVNSRPLTEVSVDPKDPEAITPNHFLIGWNAGSGQAIDTYQQQGIFDDSDLVRRQQWKQAQRLADVFWSRWVKEYRPTLIKKRKWFQTKDELKIGDIVIVVDDQAPRNTWQMGRILDTFPGNDGMVRVVDVKTASGIYRRPVAKLCKLDVLDEVLDDAALIGGKNVAEMKLEIIN